MSTNIKKTILWFFGMIVVFSALFFFVFSGLKKDKSAEATTETEKENTPSDEPQVVSKVITLPDQGNEKTDVNILRKKINIYIIDEKGANTLPIVSFVSSETFSPKSVSEAVILALGERAVDTEIGEVKEDASSVFIDLKAKNSELPFGLVDGKIEELILDCISYSILDNFNDYRTIYFTVNGEAYHSKNLQLQKDKPFINQ